MSLVSLLTKRVHVSLTNIVTVLGLKVSETKTKYLHLTRNKKTIRELKIGEYKFEGISRFTYLGSVLTENNSKIAEISERIKKEMQQTIKIENC
jgi:hypothetical protein